MKWLFIERKIKAFINDLRLNLFQEMLFIEKTSSAHLNSTQIVLDIKFDFSSYQTQQTCLDGNHKEINLCHNHLFLFKCIPKKYH